MARSETRFGVFTGVAATTYTQVGSTPATGHVWNLNINVTNRTSSGVKLRAYVADTTWTTGEPTGSTLKAAIVYDQLIAPGAVLQISGIVVNATEKLVFYNDTSSGLDIIVSGLDIS